MKTKLFKLNFTILFGLIGLVTYAQSSDPQKTCIKIDEIVNGKTIKIDTCFIGMNLAQVQKQLSALGVDYSRNIQDGLDSVNIVIDKAKGMIDSVRNKVIVINEDIRSINDGKVKVISGKNGGCTTIIAGDSGETYSISNAGKNGSTNTEITVKKGNGDSSHGEWKIYIIRKIEVQNLSDSDDVGGRTGVGEETHPFSGLQVYPNPTGSVITISYSSSNSEPLYIKIYDMNGKAVYTGNVTETGQQVNQKISLSALSPGIYFVNLVQGNQNETRKIIVQ